MAVTVKSVRDKVIKDISELLDILDPSGDSSRIYTERFKKKNDKEFIEYMNWWTSDEANDRIQIFIEEFEKNIEVDNIIKASEVIKVPLYEYVACPDINGSSDDAVTCTPEPVPVGYIQPKRMPQTVLKKSTGSLSATKRNPKTNQVTGDDKNARNSDVETYAMLSMGADAGLRELMGPRGDDVNAASKMNQLIERNGYFSLDQLDDDRTKKKGICTMDIYFHLQGMMTNIVYPPDVIPTGKKKVI